MRVASICLAPLFAAASAAAEPAEPPAGPPTGVAAGVALGEPTTATVRWAGVDGLVGADAAVGSGTITGTGLVLAAQLTVAPVVLARSESMRMPLYFGAGLRRYDHHFDPASIDEIPDVHVGVFGSLALAVAMSSGLELYGQIAPGYDVSRTESCTLMSGVDSVCPHSQSSRAFVAASLGARWYFGH